VTKIHRLQIYLGEELVESFEYQLTADIVEWHKTVKVHETRKKSSRAPTSFCMGPFSHVIIFCSCRM
jgi:hypothetical protein